MIMERGIFLQSDMKYEVVINPTRNITFLGNIIYLKRLIVIVNFNPRY